MRNGARHLRAIIALSFWLRAGAAGPLPNTATTLQICLISCSYSGAHASAVEVLHRYQPPQSTQQSTPREQPLNSTRKQQGRYGRGLPDLMHGASEQSCEPFHYGSFELARNPVHGRTPLASASEAN